MDSNWGKHCCCCWFDQKWPPNHIKNDSRIFEHPQDCCSSDSERGFWKEKVVCTFFPHSLTPEQSEDRGTSCQDIAKTDADKRFKNIYITGDDSWCFAYDPETNDRVLNGLVRHPLGRRNWNSKGPAWRPRWKFFFKSQGVVHKEFMPEGKTVSAEFYKGVMDRLLKHFQRVRPAAFCSRDFFLLHDNAPRP